ncbi:hypothetical protein ID866_11990 [Astraeus odoratus]|nr:hypothetical protein ID866_11990 [Astraeus odoratus]
MTMTTCRQAALQAAPSSHRRSSAVVVDQFRSFSAHHASAASSHSQLSQHTPTPVPQSASAQATVLQTPTQPRTLANLGNPGDPGDDDPDDGDNPFIGDDNEGEDDLQGNELAITQDSGRNKPTLDKTLKTGSNNSSAPDLSNKLGKDGKLTAAECKRRFDLNLCMFCGGNSHFSDKCPKKEAKAKAHTAMAVESTPAAQSDLGPAPKSKN